jgi:hypothetical protein
MNDLSPATYIFSTNTPSSFAFGVYPSLLLTSTVSAYPNGLDRECQGTNPTGIGLMQNIIRNNLERYGITQFLGCGPGF